MSGRGLLGAASGQRPGPPGPPDPGPWSRWRADSDTFESVGDVGSRIRSCDCTHTILYFQGL